MGGAYQVWRCRRPGARDLLLGRERGFFLYVYMNQPRMEQRTVRWNKQFIWRYIRKMLG